MKNFTFLTAMVLFTVNMANASTMINGFRFPVAVSDAEPIEFTERGIAFYVFADGQFDFNTQPSDNGGMYYKNGRRSSTNATHGAPVNNSGAGIRIEHDDFGRIRRIGNVFVNYDANDRIKRIGSVYMTYNNYALSQIGGLKIIYNRRGQITDYLGQVKDSRVYSYNSYNQYHDYGQSDYAGGNSDEQYFYYRMDGTKARTEDNSVKKNKK